MSHSPAFRVSCLNKYYFYFDSSQLTGESKVYTETQYTSKRLYGTAEPVLAINSKTFQAIHSNLLYTGNPLPKDGYGWMDSPS